MIVPTKPQMPELPTRCMHGPRCDLARAVHEHFECIALPPDGLAPKRARHLVKLALAAWNLSDLEDDATKVASELTTNSLRHGRSVTRIDSRVYIEAGQLIFEVEDNNPQPPVLKPLTAARTSGSGFGLHLVSDVSDDWGFEYITRDRKRVWAAWDLVDKPQQPLRDTAHRSPTMTITDVPKTVYPGDRRTWTISSDAACSPTLTQVRNWCQHTITGPWCLSDDTAKEADEALTSLMPGEITSDDHLTVTLIRVLAGHDAVVTVIVGDEFTRLQPVALLGGTFR
jgi:hypothetical protein